MIAFRICSAKYASRLQASGAEARWNRKGQKVIYASGSRSLACLENIVHRSDHGIHGLFKILILDVPDELKRETVELNKLPQGWTRYDNYKICREMGSSWYLANKTSLLIVPSALIPQEFNFVINTTHPDFGRIRLVGTEDFYFDPRVVSKK
jgi:RES domain-containing protein